MSDDTEKKSERWPSPSCVGWILTVVIIGTVICIFVFTSSCSQLWPFSEQQCTSRWEAFWKSPTNEIGDAFSGVGSILALIWIIVATKMQASELRAQRDEWKKISIAQDAQVKILEKQREIFEEEQLQRKYAEKKSLLDERLKGVVYSIKLFRENLVYHHQRINLPKNHSSIVQTESLANSLQYESADDILTHFHSDVRRAIGVFENPNEKINYDKSKLWFAINQILAHYQLVIPLFAHVSPDQKARLQNIQAEETIKFLEELHEKLSKP